MRYFFAFLLILSTALAAPKPELLRDGDLIFQSTISTRSTAIERATHSKYSHMGIVIFRDGKPFVLEANSTVQYTPLVEWTSSGAGGHYVVRRLADSDKLLTPDAVAKLKAAAVTFVGKPYDMQFGWGDDEIYCSELVWKIYKNGLGIEIGQPVKLSDHDLTDPLVRQEIKTCYGDKPPLNEPMISPAAMFEAPGLVTVLEE